MHSILLNPWVGFSTDNSGVLPFVSWLVGLLIVGWLGIKWWGAHIARQFERDPTAPPPATDWHLSGLAKLLLLLFVAACFGLALVL